MLTPDERRARHAAYMREYNRKNIEWLGPLKRERAKRYWEENKEKILAKRKEKPRTDRERARDAECVRRWQKRNPEKVAAAQKRYNATHPDRNKANRIRRLEQKAGRPKPLACEICGSSERRIAFDHCHRTDKFRGWICGWCNVILGYVNDDPAHLRKLIAYLEVADEPQTAPQAR